MTETEGASKWLGLSNAAKIAASTILRGAAGSTECAALMAKEMYEYETDLPFASLEKKNQREWVTRARSAIVGLNAFLFTKTPSP